MKFSVVCLMASLTSAAHVTQKAAGIDYKELHEGNHWRKTWPVGAIDDSNDDSDVLNLAPIPKVKPEPIPHTWYSFEPHTISFHDENEHLYGPEDATALPAK